VIVLDTSAAIDWMLQTPTGQRIAHRIFSRGESVHTVHLLDLEFVQVLRRMVLQKALTASRAEEAVEDLTTVRMIRYAPSPLLGRIWQLRSNLTAYDAAYVALAEG
jgi:predicted nucleic acid-binding protein